MPKNNHKAYKARFARELGHHTWAPTGEEPESTKRAARDYRERTQRAPGSIRENQRAPRKHQRAPREHPGSTQRAPESTREHPQSTQRAPREHPESSRAEQGRTEQGRAEQDRARQSRAEQGKLEQILSRFCTDFVKLYAEFA